MVCPLRTVSGMNDDTFTGLIFTVHSRAKSLQLKTTLTENMFDTFQVDEEQIRDVNIRFRVRLPSLLDCLAVFGTASLSTTSVSLSYCSEVGSISMDRIV